MQSLRDKLLKAGLVSEDQAKKSDSEVAQKNAARPPEPARAPHARTERAPRPTGERPSRPTGERPSRPTGERRFEGRRPERTPSSSAPIPKLPPLAVPNNKEFQRLEAKKQVEQDRQMRELVLATQVTVEPGDHTFYFVTRKNRLRRIEMTAEMGRKLETGELAVVERPEAAQIEHSVVPAETALKLVEISSRAVRFFNRPEQPIGFLSDDELNRRQKVESERDVAAEEKSAEETSSESPAPESAEAGTGTETKVDTAE